MNRAILANALGSGLRTTLRPDQSQVIFVTPSLYASACLEYVSSITRTVALLMSAGINHSFLMRAGDAYLSKIRNKLVTQYLEDEPGIENFFFLDDDIGWPPEKVLEFIQRPEDVLAGIYPKKSDDLDFPVGLCADPETGALIERDGLVLASGVPTGFLRIKRHVLEKMAEASTKFRDMEADGKERWFYNIFEMGPGPDGWWWGEDFAFCHKWRQMGGEVWVDPNIDFTHRGTKKWPDNLAKHMDIFRAKAAASVKKEVA